MRILLIIFVFVNISLSAQVVDTRYISRLSLQTDSASFSTDVDTLRQQLQSAFLFQYTKENEICDIKLYVKPNVHAVSLLESADYALLDSITNFNNQYYSFRVQFQHLSSSSFLRFRFQLQLDSTAVLQDIALLPTTTTRVQLKTNGEELSVGEEKVFELTSNHIQNIKLQAEWQHTTDFDYRTTESNGQVFLHVLANATGNKILNLPLQTIKPQRVNGALNYNLPPIVRSFTVKTVSLMLLQLDKTDFMLDEQSRTEGVQVQIDNNHFETNSVYLVETRETTGSPLVAQIITKERLSNNRMLCILRVFNYHRKSDGYLYMKDGNNARCLINFNVIPHVNIDRIRVMRNGKDWIDDPTLFPGETVNLRIEGQSLDKSNLHFEELLDISSDSLERSETSLEYRLKVPITISKKNVDILNFNQHTGKYINIKELQRPHPFDYILVRFGDRNKHLTEINGPELYDRMIRDLVIAFVPDKIDSESKLYGKQYLSIDIKVLGKKDEIIESTTIDNLVICPGDKSPRYQFYDKANTNSSEISLNTKINNPTYNMRDWSRIKLTFRNPADKYAQDAQSKTIEIVLQKHYKFDIDVSFPTGLLIKKSNTPGYGNFGGVSMAAIGQFSFYQPEKINRLRPYKVGAGFLALNAFDFSNNSNSRDVGAVILGSLSPMNTDRKLSFSLYLGGGYLLSAKTMFWLIGPGINVQL